MGVNRRNITMVGVSVLFANQTSFRRTIIMQYNSASSITTRSNFVISIRRRRKRDKENSGVIRTVLYCYYTKRSVLYYHTAFSGSDENDDTGFSGAAGTTSVGNSVSRCEKGLYYDVSGKRRTRVPEKGIRWTTNFTYGTAVVV